MTINNRPIPVSRPVAAGKTWTIGWTTDEARAAAQRSVSKPRPAPGLALAEGRRR